MSNEAQSRHTGVYSSLLTALVGELLLFALCYIGVFLVSGYLFQICAFAVLMAISLHFPSTLLAGIRKHNGPLVLVSLLPVSLGMWIALGLLNLSNGLLLRILYLLEPY